MILHAPGRLPAGRVIEEPTGLVDLHATLVEACGGTIDWNIEGESRMPHIRGEAAPDEGIVYGESEYSLRSFGWAPVHTLWQGRWKYIDAKEPELYDILADPDELTNRAAAEGGTLDALRSALAEHRSSQSLRYPF